MQVSRECLLHARTEHPATHMTLHNILVFHTSRNKGHLDTGTGGRFIPPGYYVITRGASTGYIHTGHVCSALTRNGGTREVPGLAHDQGTH